MLTEEVLKVNPSVSLSNEFPKAENNLTNWQILSHQICALYILQKNRRYYTSPVMENELLRSGIQYIKGKILFLFLNIANCVTKKEKNLREIIFTIIIVSITLRKYLMI